MSDPVYQIGEITDRSKNNNDNQDEKDKDKMSIISSKAKSNLPDNRSNLDPTKTQNIEKPNQNPKDTSAELPFINFKNQIEELEKNLQREKEKYEALNGILLLERSNSVNIQHELNSKIKEIAEKDKNITTLSATNNKLMANLGSLRKNVDEKFEKVSIRQVNEKMKSANVKENPIENVLKLKEKELKNA